MLDQPTLNAIVALLSPQMGTLAARQAFVTQSLYDAPMLIEQVNYEGNAREFTVNLVRVCDVFGQIAPKQLAVQALLLHLREQVGDDKYAEIDALIEQVREELSRPAKGRSSGRRIFISYARVDDEPFVERLYHDLKDEFEVWWDRMSMPNRGLTFLQEIRDAIDHADRLLLVAGPRAFTSDYVRDEWLYAYETYKGINIALRLGDYPDLPEQLSGFDAPDFRSDNNYDERLAILKRQLAEPVAPVGQFHSVPALPPHFLNRPEALDTLRELVIADVDKPTLISAEKRTTAVEGMGGIGKSVLATAFAHDRKVRFAFPDGIVWLTAGQKPSMYELYRAVGVALGDDLINYPDETTARQNAQKALADKKCLLILDDVWELPVGRAFRDLISGTSARLLITTRNLQINDLLNANEYRLKLIDKSQAADYLRSWVGDDPDLATIAEKLGYLFLALKLAGALMKENDLSGVEYLSMFDRVSDMEISDDSLEVSINLGVDTAFVQYDDRKLLYHTFGIFQEDVPVPQQTVLQLWSHLRPDVRPIDHLKTLTALVNLGLVERDEQKIVTLHDLLHSYTREKLGNRYKQTHRDLLDSYGVEEWHELPQDEPYLWHFIAHHLKEAGKLDTLRGLLLDYQFLQAKLDATDVNALIADCDYLVGDEAVRLLKSALRMSAHVLDEHKDQLPYHLTGRLWTHRDKTDIAPLWRTAHGSTPLELIETQAYPPMLQAGGALLNTMAGHKGSVNGALKLLNGHILSWSDDQTLRLWKSNGQPIAILQGHTDSIIGAQVTGDGYILSWSRDKTLRLWSLEGEPLAILKGHTDNIIDVQLMHDGCILSWSKGENFRLWSPKGEALHIHEDLKTQFISESVYTVSMQTIYLHNDYTSGNMLALADGTYIQSDKHRLIHTNSSKTVIKILHGHTNHINGILELDSELILSWSKDSTLRLWSLLEQQDEQQDVTYADSLCRKLVVLENAFMSLTDDHSLLVWSLEGKIIKTISGFFTDLQQVPDGRVVTRSEKLTLWSSEGAFIDSLFLVDHEYLNDEIEREQRAWLEKHDLISHKKIRKLVGAFGHLRRREEFTDVNINFMGDASFTLLLAHNQIISVADEIGRVIFLRVRGGDT